MRHRVVRAGTGYGVGDTVWAALRNQIQETACLCAYAVGSYTADSTNRMLAPASARSSGGVWITCFPCRNARYVSTGPSCAMPVPDFALIRYVCTGHRVAAHAIP
eukprot:3941892-Rhodomonas_salina.3